MNTKKKSIKAKQKTVRDDATRRRRRRLTKAVAGAMIGAMITGPVGAVAGAIAGASVRRGPVRRKGVLTRKSPKKAKRKSTVRNQQPFVNRYPNIP